MSNLLLLAGELRKLTDDQLVALLDRRPVLGNPNDFLDLAQALLQPKNIAELLGRLSAGEVSLLEAAIAAKTEAADLASLGLLLSDGDQFRVPDEVIEQLKLLRSLAPSASTEGSPASESDWGSLASAAVHLFETQQAITEIILDFEQRAIKLVGRGGVGIADVKRLSLHLNQPKERIRVWLDWVIGLRFAMPSNQHWWLTPAAENWLGLSAADRFEVLGRHWLALLGDSGCRELAARMGQEKTGLSASLGQVFPLANHSLDTHLLRLEVLAQDAGLSASGLPTQLLPLVLDQRFAEAIELLAPQLPREKDALIVQADLSLIAPGPLTTKTEIALRRFASIEAVGMASTYRLSPTSLSLALELGETIPGIRDLLHGLSDKPLPQPVEYLLREAESRFARLQIWPGSDSAASIIRSTENLLLTEILNDARLRPFGFWAANAASLASRFEPEVVYHGLRDLGYVAVLVDAEGKVKSPQHHKAWTELTQYEGQDTKLALVHSLRASDTKAGAEPESHDLQRQLQLAIKTKSELSVLVTGRDGQQVQFRLLPTSLANGRLRALDRKADAERTLPLERIVRIEY